MSYKIISREAVWGDLIAFKMIEKPELEVATLEQLNEAGEGCVKMSVMEKNDQTAFETSYNIYVRPVLVEGLMASLSTKDLFLYVVEEMKGQADFDFDQVPLEKAVEDFAESLEQARSEKKPDECLLFASDCNFICVQKQDKILTKEGQLIPVEILTP